MTSPDLRMVATFALALLPVGSGTIASVVTIDADNVLRVDGERVFPVGFTTGPPPDGMTPEGTDGLQELADAGGLFLRTGAQGGPWDETTFEREQAWQDAAAEHGLVCWAFLRELGSIGPQDAAREAMLRRVVTRFRDHPGMGIWKGEDEPAWGRKPVGPVERAYQIIRELDPDHPVQLTQAPRNTVEEVKAYNGACDITACDIYPVGYPPGAHSHLPNKGISVVGDYTRRMREVAGDQMPVWMVLQIAWSGVIKPGKTLRFPTFAEERFMAYQAIINGARGLVFFGGNLPQAMTPEDAALGWNWRFWTRVLRPLMEEIGRHSPLHSALVAPDSKLPVAVTIKQAFGGEAEPSEVEFCVRETPEALFLLVSKREGATVEVEFSGLPADLPAGEVMYEPPRTVACTEGRLTDWFAPLEVHVYRFARAVR